MQSDDSSLKKIQRAEEQANRIHPKPDISPSHGALNVWMCTVIIAFIFCVVSGLDAEAFALEIGITAFVTSLGRYIYLKNLENQNTRYFLKLLENDNLTK